MKYILQNIKKKKRNREDELIEQVKSILKNDLFREEKVLKHLAQYNLSFEVLDDDEIDKHFVFSEDEIKEICTDYRLRFLDSQLYKKEMAFEVILKINDLNKFFKKDLRNFKILSDKEGFTQSQNKSSYALFARTSNGNYYLIHCWGSDISKIRKTISFPLRNLESLIVSLFVCVCLLTSLLPTSLITFDQTAAYLSRYRIGAFIHLLIFFSSFAAYFFVSFRISFSSSDWKNPA